MITKLSFTTVCAAAVLFLGSTTAFAQTNKNTTDPKADTPTSEQQFVKDAAQGNLAEIKIGELAAQKGTTPQVRDFGDLMKFDHSKADMELKNIANKNDIQVPNAMNSHDQAEYDQLSKLSGQQFDDTYAHMMVQDHEKDIAAFKTEAKDASNSSIKTYARNTTPILEEHLRLAELMMHSENGVRGGK